MEGIAEATQNVVQGFSGWLSDKLHKRRPSNYPYAGRKPIVHGHINEGDDMAFSEKPAFRIGLHCSRPWSDALALGVERTKSKLATNFECGPIGTAARDPVNPNAITAFSLANSLSGTAQ